MPYTIKRAVEIDAPPEVVWDVLVDLPRYAEWNAVTPEVVSTLRPGDPVRIRVRLGGRELVVTDRIAVVDPRRELAWGADWWVLRVHRRQLLEPLPGGGARYVSTEAFEGLLAPVVRRVAGKALEAATEELCRVLKAQAEVIRTGSR